MKALGKHLIVELYNCDEVVINDVDKVALVMDKAVKASRATILHAKFHHFSPHGVSGAIIIAESHFTIHTWPEYKYCAVDIFTCGDLIDNPTALEIIRQGLVSEYYSVTEMKRGILNLPPDQINHKPLKEVLS